ncbi:MAG: polysaccharide biosynthesis protein [Clostridia bacterium]|nr:polysaccharide biosynthesis protein [Clostridia bacterium]
MEKLLKGAAILSISGIIIKIMGAFFRIPLTNWVGGDGLSYYSSTYIVYGLILTIATAGFPTAISRMVAERTAVNDYQGVKKVIKVSLGTMTVLGLVGFLAMFFGADYIATELMGNPGAKMSMQAIAPAVLIVPILSVYRGYFQGQQIMLPSALSQLVEQLFRVVFGLFLAYRFLPLGNETVSAGATAGCSIGAFFGLVAVYFMYLHASKKKTLELRYDDYQGPEMSTKELVKEILEITIPITLGACILPMVNTIDAMIVMRRLQATGWSYAEAKILWGRLGGYCDSLIAIPSVFTSAITIGVLPMIARYFKLGDKTLTEYNSKFSLRLTMMVASPCAVGIFTLAYPLLKTLYSNPNVAQEVIEAVPTLRILCVTIILAATSTTLGAVLQAVGKQIIPVRNLLVGAAFKVLVTFVLVGIPALNVNGAPFGSIACDLTIVILNILAVRKHLGFGFDPVNTYIKPLLSSVAMGIVVYGVYRLTGMFVSSMLISAGISVVAGVVCYAVLVIVTNMITKEELLALPKGDKLVKVLGRFMK